MNRSNDFFDHVSTFVIAGAVLVVAFCLIIESILSYAYEAKDETARVAAAIEQLNSSNEMIISSMESLSMRLDEIDEHIQLIPEEVEEVRTTITTINASLLSWAEDAGLIEAVEV